MGPHAIDVTLDQLKGLATYFDKPQRSATARAFAARCVAYARRLESHRSDAGIMWLDAQEAQFVKFYEGTLNERKERR